MSIDEERGRAALEHMLQAIERYRFVVGDIPVQALVDDFVRYYAAERLVEIISEASRRLPQGWKARFPQVPWADVASIGNVLRHNYSMIDHQVIYDLKGEPLLELERVVRQMALEHGSLSRNLRPGEIGKPVADLGRSEAPISRDRARLKDIIAARSFRCGETFKLVSGEESNVYFNMKPTMMDAEGAHLLARLMQARLAEDGPDYVGGLELGAVPLVSVVTAESFAKGTPVRGFIVRKGRKEHGTQVLIEGLARGEALSGKRVAVLEDVCTKGGSALKAVEEVEKAGGEAVLVLAVVDREEGAEKLFRARGIAFDALFRAHEFIPEGFERLPPVAR